MSSASTASPQRPSRAHPPARDELAELLRILDADEQGGYDVRLVQAERALFIARQLGDARSEARALGWVAETELRLMHASRARTLAREARDRLLAVGLRSEALRVTVMQGVAEYFNGQPMDALQVLAVALEEAVALENPVLRSRVLNARGMVAKDIGDYEGALADYQEVIQLSEAAGDTKGVQDGLRNLGLVYQDMGEPEAAYYYFMKSATGERASGRRAGLANALVNAAYALCEAQRYEDAYKTAEEGFAISESLGMQAERLTAQGYKGLALAGMGRFAEAASCHREAVALATASDMPRVRAEQEMHYGCFLGNRAVIEDGQGNREEAARYFASAEDFATRAADLPMLCKISKHQSDLAAGEGRHADALAHLQKHLTQTQRLHDTRAEQRRQALRTRYEVAERERELTRQRGEKERLQSMNAELSAALEEARRLRNLADEASQLKSQLLGIAAHDLKNPLHQIVGYADIIREMPLDEAKRREYATRIIDAASRMAHLVEDLLTESALGTGRFTIEKRRCDLQPIVREICLRLRPEAEAKRQHLVTQLPPDAWAQVDPRRVEAVMENLVGNAIKFSNPDATTTVILDIVQDRIVIEVRDQGPGITADDRGKLFQPFQRLSARPTGNESSTGLGLYIAQKLVHLQGGTLSMESAGRGRGTTFRVTLPVN